MSQEISHQKVLQRHSQPTLLYNLSKITFTKNLNSETIF